MPDHEWLSSIKEGDTVAVGGSFYGYGLAVVDRVTPTQLVIGASRYRRKDGYRRGDSSWDTAHIERPDAPHVVADIAEKRRIQLRANVERAARSASAESLEAALAVLKATKNAETPS